MSKKKETAQTLSENQNQEEMTAQTLTTTQKVKMLRNVNARKCCFEKYEPKELSQAVKLGTGQRRFEIDKVYELKYERAEDWLVMGLCKYVH